MAERAAAERAKALMTSEAQRAANRRNAKNSTGPRTTDGKASVSRNAFNHGLAMPVAALADLTPTVKSLAAIVAGDDAGPRRRELAFYLAEAEVDLLRIRDARTSLYQKADTDPPEFRDPPDMQMLDDSGHTFSLRTRSPRKRKTDANLGMIASRLPTKEDWHAWKLMNVIDELERLDRYERRARSRRRRAIRALDALTEDDG